MYEELGCTCAQLLTEAEGELLEFMDQQGQPKEEEDISNVGKWYSQ